jgi:hypothetical protein
MQLDVISCPLTNDVEIKSSFLLNTKKTAPKLRALEAFVSLKFISMGYKEVYLC